MSAADLPASVVDQLRKIQRLAESGVAGERSNAIELLDRLCKKHGVTPEAIFATERTWTRIAWRDVRESELLTQVICHVLRKPKVSFRAFRKCWAFELTTVEAIEVRACFEHYRRAYRLAEKEFFSAFVAKHNIYSGIESDVDETPMDPAKLERLLQMIRGMTGTRWTRPVAALTS